MLDFRIQTFLTVCKTLNFTEAAKILHITQPAVSQHIHVLEEQYDTKFFNYVGKQLTLTESGQVFWQTAMAIQHDVQRLKEELNHISACRYLNFGATLTIGEYVMPQVLLRLMKADPEVRIRMIVENTDELLKMLNEGKIDFAIIEGYYSKQSYSSITYRSERFLPVCARSYEFAAPVRCLEDLQNERLFVRESGSGTREVLERTLMERNLILSDFPHLTELGNLNAIKFFVLEGMGVSFFYESVVKEELESGKLREIPLEDFSITHEYSFLWQSGSVFSDHYKKIFDLLTIQEGTDPKT